MTLAALLLAIHLLAAVIWVGGMFFALVVLRPSLGSLEPAPRLALHFQVFRRFFLIVWHAMPLALLTGYAMLFGVYGGFGGVGWPVHVMHLTGLLMAAIFIVIFFGPWRAMRGATGMGGAGGRAATSVDRIRKLITLNLALGLLTVIVAAFGG